MFRPYIKQHAAPEYGWVVPDLCVAYGWPTDLPGGGVIGLVELGGGWVQSDINSYFRLLSQHIPDITDVSVDPGADNNPGMEADAEVTGDIMVAAASYFACTGAAATIRVYYALDDAGGIARAVAKAAADGCHVCSISWGADEAVWGKEAANIMRMAAIAATDSGTTVVAAAGDNDSGDGGPGRTNVDLPACCPNVLACGGTRRPAKITRPNQEVVWQDNPGETDGSGTGGGFSTFFTPMPHWQNGAPHGSGRMIPDLAANADPITGYKLFVHGQEVIVGGTSFVAPLLAGLIAGTGQKLGWINPKIWSKHTAFNDVTVGENGAYRATVGPDPCSGLGVPIGDRFIKAISA